MEVYLKVVFICAFFVTAECFGCLNVARESADSDPPLMGGWRHQEPKKYDGPDGTLSQSVTGYTMAAIEKENGMSNDMTKYEVVPNSPKDVYTQVVRGTNYCIKFEAQKKGCKNNGSCLESSSRMTCVAKVYEPSGSGILVGGAPVNAANVEVKCKKHEYM